MTSSTPSLSLKASGVRNRDSSDWWRRLASPSSVTEQHRQRHRDGTARGRVAGDVFGMLRRREERHPVRIGDGASVLVHVAVVNGRDRPPEVEGCIWSSSRRCRRPTRPGRSVPARVPLAEISSSRAWISWRATPFQIAVPRAQPKPCDFGLLVGPRQAVERTDFLHFVVVAGVAPAVEWRRRIGLELSQVYAAPTAWTFPQPGKPRRRRADRDPDARRFPAPGAVVRKLRLGRTVAGAGAARTTAATASPNSIPESVSGKPRVASDAVAGRSSGLRDLSGKEAGKRVMGRGNRRRLR